MYGFEYFVVLFLVGFVVSFDFADCVHRCVCVCVFDLRTDQSWSSKQISEIQKFMRFIEIDCISTFFS